MRPSERFINCPSCECDEIWELTAQAEREIARKAVASGAMVSVVVARPGSSIALDRSSNDIVKSLKARTDADVTSVKHSTTDAAARTDAWRAVIAEEESGPTAAVKLAELQRHLQTCADPELQKLAAPRLSAFLTCCLRAKEYVHGDALQLASNYTAFRRSVGWHDVRAAAVRDELLSGVHQLLDATDRHGHCLVTMRMGAFDWSSGSSFERFQRMGYYVMHRALQRESARERGVAIVLDFRGFGWSLFRKVRLGDVKRGVAMLHDCFPARLACIYVLHEPRWLESILGILRPLMRTESLRDKLILCGAAQFAAKLHAHVAEHCCPPWAGGSLQLDWPGQVDAWEREEAAWDERHRDSGVAFDPLVLLEAPAVSQVRYE